MATFVALDDTLTPIAAITEYEGALWTNRMFDHSSFSIKAAAFPDMSNAKYITKSDTYEVMVIERIKFDGTSYEIEGRGATSLYEYRTLYKTVLTSATILNFGDIIDLLVANATSTATPFTADRSLPNYTHVSLSVPSADSINGYSRSWGNLWDHMKDLLIANGYGIRLILVGNTLQPELIAPTVKSGVVFTVKAKDVISFERAVGVDGLYNTAFVAGEGEEGSRLIAEASITPSGDTGFISIAPPRKEMYVDGSSIKKDTLTDLKYTAVLEAAGVAALESTPYTDSLVVNVDESRYTFGTDYELGSIVSYSVDNMFVGYDVVSEVEESIFAGQRELKLSLGKTAPTIKELIRR